MNTTVAVIIGFAIFGTLLIFLVVFRKKTNKGFEIQNSDIVLALVCVALWLFLTGQLDEIAFGEIKIARAIKKATKAGIENQISKLLPVDAVPIVEKGGPEEIKRAVDMKAQALSFHLGRGYYQGRAIRAYLEQLTQYPYLRYIVLNNQDESFFGLVDARQLMNALRSERPESSSTPAPAFPGEQMGVLAPPRLTAESIAGWLNHNELNELKTLPGFISAEHALDSKTDRQKALEQMNTLDVQTIPVVNDAKRFVGVVDRSKLTASILTEVAAKVQPSE